MEDSKRLKDRAHVMLRLFTANVCGYSNHTPTSANKCAMCGTFGGVLYDPASYFGKYARHVSVVYGVNTVIVSSLILHGVLICRLRSLW